MEKPKGQNKVWQRRKKNKRKVTYFMAFFPLVIQVSGHMCHSHLPVSDMTCLWMLELETTANLFRQQLT